MESNRTELNLDDALLCRIHPWGWRLSLSLAGIPALLLTLGALFVVDTPNSLIERGRLDEGKAVLKKIRGTDNVEPEFNEIVEASRIAQEVKHPFRNLLKRRNRPQLVIAVLLQVRYLVMHAPLSMSDYWLTTVT
jgi:MFS transporter, SP family, sugar:H+ symporter